MEKSAYEKLMDIKKRLEKGEPTTFAERNVLNMYNKKMSGKQPKKSKSC
jgi:hypothetical protein